MFTLKTFLALLVAATTSSRVGSHSPRVPDLTVTDSGWLNDGGYTSFEVWLSSGTTYSIEGWCDDDCTDLDLELYNAAGTRVASDLASDAYPAITFTPRYFSNGQNRRLYRVRVLMASCVHSPCRYTAEVTP